MNNLKESSNSAAGIKSADYMQFLAKIVANWHWFLISGLVGILIAFFYVNYKTPIYKVSARVLINDENKGGGMSGQGDLLDIGSLLGGKSSVDNEVEVLKTRYLMEKVVNDLNATVRYYEKTGFKNREVYKSPFSVRLISTDDSLTTTSFDIKSQKNGEFLISNSDVKMPGKFGVPLIIRGIGILQIDKEENVNSTIDDYSFVITSFDGQVAAFLDNLNVSVANKLVSIVDLSFNYPIPKRGEDILNALIKNYRQENINDKNVIADSTISFIEERLVYVSRELGGIETEIKNFKQSRGLADISEQSKLLVNSSSDYVKQLADTEMQLNILTSLEEYLKDEGKNKRVFPSGILPQDMVFSGLIERYNTLLLERDRQSLSSTDSNPYVQNLDQQISNLRKDMLSNLINTRRSLLISRSELQKRGNRFVGEIKEVPATEKIYLDLARQQQIKQELYVFLLQKREETAISKTSNISNSKVIDPPKSEPMPFSPNKMLFLMIGAILGLAFPFSVLYLQDLLNTRVVTKEDVTTMTNIPIIAEISNSKSIDSVVIRSDSRTAIAEQFRALRTNLQFFMNGKDEKVILLTSSMSGEGKSFVSLNLANVLAISGKKVVVMEMDLRKPNLSNKLDIDNSFGFTNYIISPDIKPSDITVPSKIHDNLFLISSGPIPPNPAETILNGKMDLLIDSLKENFDFVIIDAPPIGIVTDAQLLSKYANLTLYLLRQRYTFKSQLNIANDIYVNSKMNKIALLINDVKESSSYGYGYGYGYGYMDGYTEETRNPKKSWLRRISFLKRS